MHLAIDAIGAKYGGGATELIDVLNAALDEQRISKITLFCSPEESRVFSIPSCQKLTQIPRPWVTNNYALRMLWYECGLGMECRKIGADLLFISANFGRGRFRVPHVTHIQQSLPFSKEAAVTFQSAFDHVKINFYRRQMKRSCLSASRVICQSTVMKHSIAKYFHLNPDEIEVVYSAPKRLRFTEEDTLDSGHQCRSGNVWQLLYVGSDYPYKKIDTALDGMQLIRQSYPLTEIALTLPTDHDYAYREGVKCVGYLNDAELAKAYQKADLLVLPSLVESGPQPPIEAMSLGTPVLVADRPYAHDICEDAAVFFDPNSPEDFAEKAIHLLNDEKLRQELIAKGFALVERRRAAEPYKQIVQILLDAADGRKGQQ